MADIDQTIEDIQQYIDERVGNPREFSQVESAEAYETLAAHCADWARLIRSEMGE